MTMNPDAALVVFSGGQDSTTCLAWAKKKFGIVRALSFNYGQRHAAELEAAERIVRRLNVPWTIADMRGFGLLSKSALTDSQIQVDAAGGLGGLPSTFTPCRNLVFLSAAASHAISLGIRNLVTGVCQTDYSGYPDCRREFIDALETTIRVGNGLMKDDFEIHTPLMHLTKAETVKLAQECDAMELLAMSHTCYEGKRPACGKCPACVLRLKGFQEAGVIDPIAYE